MNKNSKIFIAGHGGLVGSALVRCLQDKGYTNLLTRTRQQINLLDQSVVHTFMSEEKPDFIFIAAARVGGIEANNRYRADFLYENLVIETILIHAAYEAGVNRLLFLGSSCIYPRDCPQPIKEEYLLTGPLEPTNEPYAVAKIAGIKLCESFNRQYGTKYVSVMPTNLYGPGDNFDPETSHVLPALIRKYHEAKVNNSKKVTVWGTGRTRREFLYVDDMADACVFQMERDIREDIYNIGTGSDIKISELAALVGSVVGIQSEIDYDTSKLDGSPQKLLDVSLMHFLGWNHKISIEQGIRQTYQWYLKSKQTLRSEV